MSNLLLAQQQRATLTSPVVPGLWTHQQIADIIQCPVANVDLLWPQFQQNLINFGCLHRNDSIAVLATVGVESGAFTSIDEYGGSTTYGGHVYDYFFYMYDIDSPNPDRRLVARQLGNVNPGDGARFHGRGPGQLTGRGNYRAFGQRIGIDLENNPERALEPAIATAVMVLFMLNKGIFPHAEVENWNTVRYLYNGGYNGIQKFWRLVNSFLYTNVLEDWRVTVLASGGGFYGLPYVWGGHSPATSFDCSGFVSYLYGLVGRPLTPYTDAAFDETVAVSVDSALAGDIVFYEYADQSQPGTRFPHMGLWLDQSRTLDARGGVGVGVHAHVGTGNLFVRRYP